MIELLEREDTMSITIRKQLGETIPRASRRLARELIEEQHETDFRNRWRARVVEKYKLARRLSRRFTETEA